MHVLSTVGCALAILPLALSDAASVTPAQATALLCLFNSFYAASFGGFHPYVQVRMCSHAAGMGGFMGRYGRLNPCEPAVSTFATMLDFPKHCCSAGRGKGGCRDCDRLYQLHKVGHRMPAVKVASVSNAASCLHGLPVQLSERDSGIACCFRSCSHGHTCMRMHACMLLLRLLGD